MHHFNYAGVEWTCTRLELNNWIIPTLVFFLCNKRQRPAVFLKFENRYESIKIWFTFPIFFLFFQNIHILFLLDIYFIINPLTIDLSYCFHQHVSNHFNPYFHKLNFSKKKKKYFSTRFHRRSIEREFYFESSWTFEQRSNFLNLKMARMFEMSLKRMGRGRVTIGAK